MSYEAEIPKEFLRNAFMRGTLDITDSYKSVEDFVRIFRGEMEALVAISHCGFLSKKEAATLMKIAAPTDTTMRHYETWLERLNA